MLVRPSVLRVCAGLLLTAATAQQQQHVAYPERDILSPFREPADVYAPPDEVFRILRAMQTAADRPRGARSYDSEGREVVDDPAWREAKAELDRVGVDGGYLAQIMRLHKNGTERATAFYGAFFVKDRDHVFNLISHIPGEPVRATRAAALPRAVQYVRAHLSKRFGDLPASEKEALVKSMPPLGSPMAKARDITRLPTDSDHLHTLNLRPFFQLVDRDEALDQAQGLWFLKEVFAVRRDLAQLWLEPALPRLRQLLLSADAAVRTEAIGVVQSIGTSALAAPPSQPRELLAWADEAFKVVFPPIRNLNDAIIQIYPSPERDALADAGRKALAASAIGDAFVGKRGDGTIFRGFRVALVPDELRPLAIPQGAIITAVNGVAVTDAKSLQAVVEAQLQVQKHPRTLLVEFLRDGASHAVEFRLM